MSLPTGYGKTLICTYVYGILPVVFDTMQVIVGGWISSLMFIVFGEIPGSFNNKCFVTTLNVSFVAVAVKAITYV